MKFNTLLKLSALVSHVQALPMPSWPEMSGPKAVYFQTNEKNNSVVSLMLHANGSLTEGGNFCTNGVGSAFIMANNMTSGPDALSSQGAVTVAGTTLFAVNAGDDSVSMFSIDESEPTKLTFMGKADLPGEFPVTVTASELNGLVCVAMSGSKAGVACASYCPEVGIGAMDFLRPFPLNQSTPPKGPLGTVGQILFSEDESSVITTVKGNPAVNESAFISVFPVTGSCYKGKAHVAASGTKSYVDGIVAPFGFQQIATTEKYFVADPAFGVTILAVDENYEQASLLHKTNVTDQKAICWAAISPVSGTAFVTDPMLNRIVEFSIEDASILSITNTTSANTAATGFTDLTASGEFLLLLAPSTEDATGTEIVVVDVASDEKKVVDTLKFDGVGKLAQGMAVY